MQKCNVKNWRDAATLIIAARSCPAGRVAQNKQEVDANNCAASSSPEDYKVLLLKRSSKSTFMPNRCVFPGGVISPADFSPKWLDLFHEHGVSTESIHSLVGIGDPPPPLYGSLSQPGHLFPEIAFRLCALRETFEESGLLISRSSHGASTVERSPFAAAKGMKDIQDMERWRQRVMNNPAEFIDLFREIGCIPDIWSLYEWSNWLTPAFEKKRRFDTMFYICMLDNEVGILEDGMEIVEFTWQSPSECLDNHAKETIILAPPQIYEMCRLRNDSLLSSLASFAMDREQYGMTRFEPMHMATDDGTFHMFLPGDELFGKVVITPEAIAATAEAGNLNRYALSPTKKRLINNVSVCGHRTFNLVRDDTEKKSKL